MEKPKWHFWPTQSLAMLSSVSCAFFFFKQYESNLPLEIRFLQFCLVFKSFLITYPKTFFEGRCHLQPCRPCELQCPWAQVFEVLFWEPTTRRQDCFKPQSGYWGNLNLRGSPLPDWKLEDMCLSKHPRDFFYFLFLTFHY